MTKTKIAIIGYGFVGKAVEFGFRNKTNDVMIVDPYKGHHNIDEMISFNPDFVFVCVPTPMNDDGSINKSIINSVVNQLNTIDATVIVKSTITPDVVKEICCNNNFVYNPEFLTERNAFEDFLTPNFHILGGQGCHVEKVRDLYTYNSSCNPAPFHYMTPVEASLVKYGVNSFLAMKVIWFNQWKELTESLDARYNVVSSSIGEDDRIGHSHMKVPGLDGKKGFGGSCFPKDTAAIAAFSKLDGVCLSLLEEVINANLHYRSESELDHPKKVENITYGK
jgi:nucleotide sugar dehydrogenase